VARFPFRLSAAEEAGLTEARSESSTTGHVRAWTQALRWTAHERVPKGVELSSKAVELSSKAVERPGRAS
jgi:hypothetical protein